MCLPVEERLRTLWPLFSRFAWHKLPAAALMLSRIKLNDFRCFEVLELSLSPGVQFFTGDNAQGKTSILEAACVLLRLASPRAPTLAPLVRFGAKGFAVQGAHGTSQMQYYFSPVRRKLVLDSLEQFSTREYLRVARLVYFGNTDLELVRGGADGRRRFLDFLGAQIEPLYRTNLRAYERALRSRNRLLKSVPVRRREVEAYDQPLLDAGGLLTRLRHSLVEELAPWVSKSQQRIRITAAGAEAARGGNEELTLHYQPGAGEDFAVALRASREEENRLRQTLVGPHRDDLLLQLDGAAAGVFGSEGQQRTLALALKLGQAGLLQAIWKAPPLLLLDDIFGELDPLRRNALLAALPTGGQQLIATTHLDWLDGPPDGPVWRVHERRLETVYDG